MAKLYFDVRDVFRALRLGWSGKKMVVGFEGLALSYVGYVLLTYLAYVLSGRMSPARIWDTYNLFPRLIPSYLNWYGWVVYIVGVVFAALVLLLFGSMICKIAHQQLKGDDFYSMGDAGGFLKRNWKAIVFSPLGLLAMFVLCGVCGWIIGLLGRIPYVGEWGFALVAVLTFSAALLTVYIGVVFLLSLVLTPSVVGSTREDTMETVIQLFSTAWSQPWRLVIYEAIMAVLVVVGTRILAAFSGAALWLVSAICGLGMGDKLSQMAGVAMHYLPTAWATSPLGGVEWLRSIPGVSGVVPQLVSFDSVSNGSVLWAGRLLAIMLIVIGGVVASYAYATWCSGQTLIYIALRKKKDEENLLERKDEREEEEEERQRQREREEKEKKEEKEEKEGAEEPPEESEKEE